MSCNANSEFPHQKLSNFQSVPSCQLTVLWPPRCRNWSARIIRIPTKMLVLLACRWITARRRAQAHKRLDCSIISMVRRKDPILRPAILTSVFLRNTIGTSGIPIASFSSSSTLAGRKKNAAASIAPVSIPKEPQAESKATSSNKKSASAKEKGKGEPNERPDPTPKDGIQIKDVKAKKSKKKALSDATEAQKNAATPTALTTKGENRKNPDKLSMNTSKKTKDTEVPPPAQKNKDFKTGSNFTSLGHAENTQISSAKTPIEKKPKEAQVSQVKKTQIVDKSKNERFAKIETGLQQKFFEHPLSIPVTYITETPDVPAEPQSIEDTGLSIDQRFFCTSLLRRAVSNFGSDPHRPYINSSEYSPDELLDRFLDSVAFIFDTGPSSKTVTASALRDDNGPVLLLVSNSSMEKETFAHAQQILERLKRFNFGSEMEENLESDIVRILVIMGSRRIDVSQNALRILVSPLIKENKLDEISMGTLRSLQHIVSDPDPHYVCRACHGIITHDGIKHLQQTYEKQFPKKRSISQIRHFLVLLASVFSVTKILIRTLRLYRELFKNIRVEVIPSAPRMSISGPKMPQICRSISTIVPVVFSVDQRVQAHCLELLQRQDVDVIHRRLDRNLSKAQTIVHAETALVNYFRRENHRFFFPTHRYIGCSKDACYLCQLYFSSLRGLKIELRGCHKEIFLPGRIPQHRENSDREVVMENMM
ncbi:hypothetical protein BZA77DRAFT_343256, partial [Pyronema omphalodes]